MDAERERRLEEAGVTWDPLEAQWEENFALLVEYRDREGGCDVPRKHEERGVKLGPWLSKQRQARKKGTMDAERERRLEKAGVRWRISGKQFFYVCAAVLAAAMSTSAAPSQAGPRFRLAVQRPRRSLGDHYARLASRRRASSRARAHRRRTRTRTSAPAAGGRMPEPHAGRVERRERRVGVLEAELEVQQHVRDERLDLGAARERTAGALRDAAAEGHRSRARARAARVADEAVPPKRARGSG